MKKLLSLLCLSLVSFAAPVFTISPNIGTAAPGGIADPFCLCPSLQCALFSGTIDPDISNVYFLTSALGIYTGTVTFFGGLNPGELNVLGSREFTLVVAPEPATASMVLLGCAGIALARFRKR